MTTSLSAPGIAADTEWRRLSPRMLLVHPVIELGKAVPALLGAFVAGSSSGRGAVWSAIVAGVVIAFALMRWVTTRFRITPEQIQLQRGLLRRTTMAAPLDQVRTVDVTAHALHRVLGLAKVVVGTGTSDRKGRDRLVLDGLGADSAARRRRLVRAAAGVLALFAAIAAVSWLTGASPYVWLASLGLLAVAVPLGLDRYRSLGHALVDGYVVASCGSLIRRRSAIACDGIIGWNLKSTFFQRRIGLTTLTATTAAGKQSYHIYDVSETDAVGFAERAVPGLLSQFGEQL